MVTIEALAQELSDLYDIDLGAARADVVAFADQISDDPELYDIDGGNALSDTGAGLIRDQMSSVYGSGSIDMDEARYELRSAQALVDAADELGRRDAAVRKALATSVPVKDIVADTGLSRARVYQIRDRRR